MKINFWLYLLKMMGLSCLFFSCLNNSGIDREKIFYAEDGSFSVKTFYDHTESVKSWAFYNSDSVLHGTMSTYYPNGVLTVEKDYINGKKEGVTKGYFKNGEVKYIGQYREDKKDSTWIWNDQSSNGLYLCAIEHYTNDKLFGGVIELDSNGHISAYKFFNFNVLFGKITFNKDQPKIEGDLLFIWYNRNTVNKQEDFTLTFFVGVPPDWNSSVKLELLDKTKNVVPNESFNLSEYEYHYDESMKKHGKTFRFNKSGTFMVKYIVKITDENNDTMYSDTSSIEVVVR